MIAGALHYTFQGALSDTEIERITRGVFFEFWDEIFAWAYTDSNALAELTDVVGLEHLRAASFQGRGVILWECNSYGKRTVTKHVLHAHGIDVTQLHAYTHVGGMSAGGHGISRFAERVLVRYFDRRSREIEREVVYLHDGAGLGFTRELVKRLEQNAILCVAMEGKIGKHAVILPYLGLARPFQTGTPSLSRLTSAPLLPIYCVPTANGRYLLEIEPPLVQPTDVPRGQVVHSILARQVDKLDARIRAHPEWSSVWDRLFDKAVQSPDREA